MTEATPVYVRYALKNGIVYAVECYTTYPEDLEVEQNEWVPAIRQARPHNVPLVY